MSNGNSARAAELAAIIARRSTEKPHVIAARVVHLQRIARQAHRAAENLCSLPDFQPRYDRKVAALRNIAGDLCGDLGPGFAVKIGGDPRGPCCWLAVEGERGDDMGERGYGIY